MLPNMTVYFELFYIDQGVDAFHVEDLVLVTDHGPQILSNPMDTTEMFVI